MRIGQALERKERSFVPPPAYKKQAVAQNGMLQLICIFILKADDVLVIFLPKANAPLSSLSLGFWP